MPCINPDGSLSDPARFILTHLRDTAPASAETLRDAGEFPLWQIRASLREMTRAGLVAAKNNRQNITETGKEALQLDEETRDI